jgi:hypothetical protein
MTDAMQLDEAQKRVVCVAVHDNALELRQSIRIESMSHFLA